MIGTSSTTARAADSAVGRGADGGVDVGRRPCRAACAPPRATAGSPATVLELSVWPWRGAPASGRARVLEVEVHDRDPHAPVERLDEQHVLAGAVLVTKRSGISLWAWPTRIASTPGTCSATSDAAFSGYGSASPYDERGVGAAVGGDDHHVAAAALELGHEVLGLLDEAGELHPALDVGLVPDRDAGVGQAEDADLEVGAVAQLEAS